MDELKIKVYIENNINIQNTNANIYTMQEQFIESERDSHQILKVRYNKWEGQLENK